MPSGQIVRIQDGTILAADLGGLKFASPIVQDGTVYLMQAGSSAQRFSPAAPDRWNAAPVWEQELEGTFYASALWDRGLIYAVSNENLFTILDAGNGKILATKELETHDAGASPAASAPNMYPSITLAGNYLFVLNDLGEGLVLQPGREYKELKRNHLAKGHGGTPAFDGRHLYLRSGENLCCIGEK